MYSYLKSFIETGAFEYNDMTHKLDKMYIESKITEAERDELLSLCAEKAVDSRQVDLFEKIVALEHRVQALETKDIPVWVAGYTTNKGETVKYDYDGDGTLDLLRYDGGRSYTSLKPGKIDGWHVVDSEGNILGTFLGDTFTPEGSEQE